MPIQTMTGGLVSVIMPVYNVDNYIEKAVASVLTQSYQRLELILVDDGSTDKSGAICDALAKTDDRIVVLHKENGGLSSARNAGLDVAKGEFIYFVDSDDWIERTLLSDSVEAMQRDGGVDLVYFKATREDEKGNHLYDVECLAKEYLFADEEEKFRYIVSNLVNYVNGWEVCFRLFRNSIIQSRGLRFQNEREVFAEDYLFSFSYIMMCDSIRGIDKIYYHYMQRTTSLMESSKNNSDNKILRLNEFGKRLLEWAIKCECKVVEERIHFVYYLIFEWHMREFARNNNIEAVQQLEQAMMGNEFHARCMEKYINEYEEILERYGGISGYTSVIVPIYNIENYIDKCVQSIVEQSCTRLQIILVDDGAKDGSGKLCDKWQQRDYRIKAVHKKNGGLSSARNAGLDVALGQYIIFVDGDDYIDKDLVTTSTMALAKNQADICTYRAKKVNENGMEPFGKHYDYGKIDLSDDKKKFDFLYNDFFIYNYGWEAWKSVFTADIIRKNNLRFISEREVFAEDLLFTAMYLICSDNIMCITDFLYYYVDRQNSLMNEKKENIMILEFNRIAEYIYRMIDECQLTYCRDRFYRLYERIMFWHVAYLMWKVEVEELSSQTRQIADNQLCIECIKKLLDNKPESVKLYGREEFLRNYCYTTYVYDNNSDEYKRNWKRFLRVRKYNMLKNKLRRIIRR